jgi:hypothetical protein
MSPRHSRSVLPPSFTRANIYKSRLVDSLSRQLDKSTFDNPTHIDFSLKNLFCNPLRTNT